MERSRWILKKELTEEVWSKSKYYDVAAEGSMDFGHPAMKMLVELSKNSHTILDMGCGEGTRLYKIAGEGKEGYGIDISPKAISIARAKFPGLKLRVGDLEKLPFKDKTFDLVYSAFVFEHLDNPEGVIKEAVRVLKRRGVILVVAPNYGAPNRISPPNKRNRLMKILTGFIRDFFPARDIGWTKIDPIATENKYEIDYDVTIEPYLGSLISFFKGIGLKIKYYSSCWEQELPEPNMPQKIFRLFGARGIYPFNLWGPHLLIVGEKIK